MKKQYDSPDIKIYSFSFEPVAEGTPTPFPMNGTATTSKPVNDMGLATEIPDKYSGTLYAGIEYSENMFTEE